MINEDIAQNLAHKVFNYYDAVAAIKKALDEAYEKGYREGYNNHDTRTITHR